MSILRTEAIQTLSGKPILNSSGSVLQVVQGTRTTQSSTTSTSYVDVGLSASISPTSSTSQVFIIVTGAVQNDTANGGSYVRITRNGTGIWFSNLQQFSAGGNNICAVSLSYLDQPATTASTTYALQFARYNTGTTYIYQASIQLLEIT